MAALWRDIWASFRRLPVWVQVWVGLILVPVNLSTVLALGAPFGGWIAFLSWAALLINVPIILIERGLGRVLSLSHLLLWTPQVVLILWVLLQKGSELEGPEVAVLGTALVVNMVSLVFDLRDFSLWVQGERGAA